MSHTQPEPQDPQNIQSSLTPENLAALREPFPPEQIGKRPIIYCQECRNSPGKVCPDHAKVRCNECGQSITSAHFHLDYVGHADVTNRLLDIDPDWNWEPLAIDTNGLPMLDKYSSLWMRVTICGKTMIGYGSAPGKDGSDAIKEIIGDGIRNAAMRYGVGLGLWGGKFARMAEDTVIESLPNELTPIAAPANTTQIRKIRELWETLGFIGQANLTNRLNLASHTLGRELADEQDITCDEAVSLIRVLQARVVAKQAADAKTAKAAKASPNTGDQA